MRLWLSLHHSASLTNRIRGRSHQNLFFSCFRLLFPPKRCAFGFCPHHTDASLTRFASKWCAFDFVRIKQMCLWLVFTSYWWLFGFLLAVQLYAVDFVRMFTCSHHRDEPLAFVCIKLCVLDVVRMTKVRPWLTVVRISDVPLDLLASSWWAFDFCLHHNDGPFT